LAFILSWSLGFVAEGVRPVVYALSVNNESVLIEANKHHSVSEHPAGHLDPLDDGRTPAFPIAILPCTSIIVLQCNGLPFLPKDLNRGSEGEQAKVSMMIQSLLPRWGVSIEASPLKGPDGDLPPDRLLAKTEVTQNTFQPLNRPTPVLIGDRRLPIRQTSFDIKVQPSWSDKPGRYQGSIIAKPFLPQGGSASLASDSRNEALGGSQVITVGLEIEEHMLVSVSQTEIKFDADAGPGIYTAKEEVYFTVTTNAATWRVDCHTSPLTRDKSKIPVERISWERVNKLGRVEASGKLGVDETVVTGIGPIKDFEARLRFKVQIKLEDPPGDYEAAISLEGITAH